MARRVPMCRAISKSSASACHPSSHEVRYKCAVLLIGKNSVSPWTTARTITCKSGIRLQGEGWSQGMSSVEKGTEAFHAKPAKCVCPLFSDAHHGAGRLPDDGVSVGAQAPEHAGRGTSADEQHVRSGARGGGTHHLPRFSRFNREIGFRAHAFQKTEHPPPSPGLGFAPPLPLGIVAPIGNAS